MAYAPILQVREGFIVDEDEDEDDVDEDDADVRPVVKRKREHRDREEEEQLDEDDLELIGEQFGERPKPQSQVSFRDGSLRDLNPLAPLTLTPVPVQTS